MTGRRSEGDGQGSFVEAVVAHTKADADRKRQRESVKRSSERMWAARDWVAANIPEAVDSGIVDGRWVGCALMVRFAGHTPTAELVRERFEARYGGEA
jgi:hypothetical protein